MHDNIPIVFRDIFRKLVIALQPRALERDAVAVYYEILGEFELEDLATSALLLAQTTTFFPTSGEWFQTARRVESRRRAEEYQAFVQRRRAERVSAA